MAGSLRIFAVSGASHWGGSDNIVVNAYSFFILWLLLRGPMGSH